jgi:hypothetical protein
MDERTEPTSAARAEEGDAPGVASEAPPSVVEASMVVFLETALSRNDPRADVAAADAIAKQLLSALDSAVDWDAALWRVGAALARSFSGRASNWSRIGELLALHFRLLFVADHPRAQRSTQQRTPTGETLSPVRFDLVRPFVRTAMLAASPVQRAEFYKSITSHEVWGAAAANLTDAGAAQNEMLEFLEAHRAMKIGLIPEAATALAVWAEQDPERAATLAMALARRDVEEVSAGAIQVIVETLTKDPARDAWRSEIVDALFATRNRMAWALVVALECFAAPPSATASERHERMMARVSRAPTALLPAALRALWRDARSAPTESLVTLGKLLELAEVSAASPNVPQDFLLAAADVATSALSGLRNRGESSAPVEGLLPTLLYLEPNRALHGLDMVLDGLLEERNASVKAFLAEWLGVHARAIVPTYVTLTDLLPLVAHRLGPDNELQWLIDVMIDGSPPGRQAAASLIGARNMALSDAALSFVSETNARILVHEMIGCGRLGVHIVNALLRLALRWPSLVGEIGDIVANEIAPNYPNACQDALALLNPPGLVPPPEVRTAQQEAVAKIDKVLKDLSEAHRARMLVPEVVRVAPAAAQWYLAQQREVDKAYRAGRRRSALASLIPTVPIGRGNKSLMAELPNATATGFQAHSFSMTLPAREVIDPLGERLRQFEHIQRADSLRKARASAP